MPTPRPLLWDDLQLLGTARLGGDGADTFAGTIFPQSFALHFRSDSDGSTAQNTKY